MRARLSSPIFSKGRLGEDNANLLGALLVTTIQQAAMSRADIPEEDRRDFYFYVDEFQNYTTGSFAEILSEARKYRLNLTVAHQYMNQLDDQTRDAVFGNVGSMIAFQVGSDDAEFLARQLRKFPDQIMPEDLSNLPKYHAYVRLLHDGMPTPPFSMATFPPKPIAAAIARLSFAGLRLSSMLEVRRTCWPRSMRILPSNEMAHLSLRPKRIQATISGQIVAS